MTDRSPTGDAWLVAAIGPLPGPPKVVRIGKYADLLRVFGLSDPVPLELRAVFATAWRALSEGVPRVYVASEVSGLAELPEPLVVAGATALPDAAHAAARLWLYDPPTPPQAPGEVPEGMVGLWPWVSAVLPGTSGAVPLPPSALAAGLYATGAAFSTYPSDASPGAPPEGDDWVRLVPAGRRRLLHLDPAPPRPGSPFPVSDVASTEVELLWAEARLALNPVEALTRALHARYGHGVRVFLEDEGVKVVFPPPAQPGARRGVTLRWGARPG